MFPEPREKTVICTENTGKIQFRKYENKNLTKMMSVTWTGWVAYFMVKFLIITIPLV